MTGATRDDSGSSQLIERRFDQAMTDIYERAGREVGYWATRYLQLLRKRGGLGTARYLLGQKATSDGYARLREAGRLDLTVEALVLRPEFAPLFTPEELALARSRYAVFDKAMQEDRSRAEPVSPELAAVLAQAAEASPAARIEFRDRAAQFGLAAIPAIEEWVDNGHSLGFACATLEAIGRDGHVGPAVRAMRRLRARHPALAAMIDAAIARLDAGPSGGASS